MANYYLDSEGKLTTKNDKKKKKSTDYYLDGKGNLVPIDDVAPVKDERTWFKKGAFSDGYDFGDITKTILGTGKDVRENVYAGVVGMAEKAIDAGATLLGGAGGLFGADDFQANMRKFVEKDLIDEKKVARTMDNITGGATSWISALNPNYSAEEASLFGDKTDSLLQSAGQLAGTVALQSVGVPWFVTTGTTSFGGQAEEAFKEDATYGQAVGSALISAGAEVLTEKLSGGISFGGKTLDDVWLKPLTEKIASKATRTLVNLGMDAAGEGAEEVITSVISNLGTALYKEESIGELLASEEAMDEYIESFIGGAVLGGGINAGKAVNSIATGRDYKTGLTENEQTVINKEVENRIKDREESGETLSSRDKKAIKEQVESDLAKGYIDIDTIESTLGGETYSQYKSLTDQESALKKEIDSLENLPKEQITVKQSERLKEAREQLEGLDTATVKERLGQEVSELAKSDRLSESYNEKARRSQAFEADLTKYSEKERAVVQKAAESGILNNTNKTHDFVDMVAKISAEKGVSFDFTNNQKLKDSGFAVEGKTINGYVKDGNIAVNIDSAKSLNSVVGHEITHVLEGTELYGELQKAVKEYATTKGEYQKRFIETTKLYNGVEGADIDAEITADLVGDYLFTDSDFINKLSAEQPNIFKRIYEEIKYLVKLATAGSEQARQLEKVKRAFDKAYKESGKASADTKYSVSDSEGHKLTKEQQEYFKDSKVRDENGNLKVMYHGSQNAGFHEFNQRFSDDDISFFFVDNNDIAKGYSGTHETYAPRALRTADDLNGFFKEIKATDYTATEENGTFTLYEDGDEVATSDTADGLLEEFRDWTGLGYGSVNYKVYLNLKNPLIVDAQNNNWDDLPPIDGSEVYDYIKVVSVGDRPGEVTIEYATNTDSVPITETVDLYEKFDGGIADRLANLAPGESVQNVPLSPMKTRDYAKYAKENGYDGVIFNNIVDAGLYASSRERYTPSTVAVAFDASQIKSTENTAPTSDLDIRYSLSADSEGRELAPAIQKRFANSKAVNENGELKVLYHGTPSGEFTIFDKSKGSVEGDFGSGFYFTDNEADVTEHYEGGGPDFENKVARRAEQIEQEEDIDYDEAVERAREELFVGGHKFEVYLNIENPAIVGETTLFDNESYLEEYNEEDYEDYDDYIADVEQAVADDIENIVWEVEKNVDVYNVDGLSDVLFEAYYDGGIGIEELKAKINDLYLEDENGNMVGNEVTRQIIESLGYDGIIDPTVSHKWNMDMEEGTTHYIVFKPNQIKAVNNENPTDNPDIHKSLSANGEQPAQRGRYNVYGRDIALNQDVAPVAEPASEEAQDDIAPVVSGTDAGESENWRDAVWNIREPENGNWTDEYVAYYNSERAKAQRAALKEALDNVDGGLTPAELMQKSKEAYSEYERVQANSKGSYTAAEDMMLASLYGQYTFYDSAAKYPNWAEEMRAQFEQAPMTEDQANERDERQMERLYSLDENSDMPSEAEAPYTEESAMPESPFDKKDIKEVGNRKIKAYMYENPEVKPFFQEEAQNMLGELKSSIKGEKWYNGNLHYETGGDMGWFGTDRMTSPEIAYLLDNFKYTYAEIEKGLLAIIEDHGAENNAVSKRIEFLLDERLRNGYTHFMYGDAIPPNQDYIRLLAEKQITEYNDEAFNAWASTLTDADVPATEDIAPVRETKAPVQAKAEAAPLYDAQPKKGVVEGQLSMVEEPEAPKAITRSELHSTIMDKIKTYFAERGFDFDEVLKKAKNLSTFRTVDNTPQRVMEKALGYKEGQALSDLTVNQVAQNETEGIRWLSSFTDRKNGLLAQISKQYHIKPGSKESAAAQMYAEGFYVGENNDIIAYSDAELAKDFPNRRVQENIKALARDGRIRQIYDETLRMINESRARNAYPEIPRLDNYFLHFRAMDDTFSRLGLPFNPNDIRAKDLPTDLNGVTADLKPGQPYFASAMHRTGKRTSFDLLGGLERYLTSAKNQIYHIDDIQTLRALRNYIADTYGQAKGLEGIDTLSEEEAQERISQVYGSHLSTFAKFLNEEANTLAGKTALIDRGLEGIIGRRGITFLDTINRQVGANMVGFNVSSSLTNFLSVVQAFAKSNKASFVKAFAQTTANKLGSLVGRGDGFADQSPVMIRRKGADRFYRTPWQKAGDAGYFLMGAVDNISTELIARTKYNELVSKGMDAQKAHYETDKWVSRLMGDRSLGQQPQLYNSKMLGLFTKFQLEVRNQLDSQFYDTIQEAKVSNEEIENGLARNARTAAKVTSTFFQLAVAQHLFGKAFESIAGYNPAFDILGALIKAFGFDDDEESEDTVLDNVEQGFLELLGDLPYASTFTGGRIPIESALPIEQFITGKDDYGNEKSRLETLAEAAPYYLLPSGFGQIKKTYQGSQMFDDDLPIAGSYTDSGNLRFSVEDTTENRLQAGLFGQWASDEARDYFDNERSPLKEKQIQELVDLDLPIREYWDYRKGLSEQETLEDKFEYINSQPVSTEQKNIMINNVVDRKEPVDMSNYDDFADYEEFDFYTKNTEKYNFLQENGVSYSEYKSSEEAKEEYDNAYSWVKNNPDKVTVAKAVTDNVIEYRRYANALNDIRADKDANGKTINGSAKEKKIAYIDSLNIDYGAKLILFKSEYKSDDTYNYELLEYLNSRDDITWGETVSILTELGFTVRRDGTVEW